MSEAVQEILRSIQQLPEEDRLILEERLAELVEAGSGASAPVRTGKGH